MFLYVLLSNNKATILTKADKYETLHKKNNNKYLQAIIGKICRVLTKSKMH